MANNCLVKKLKGVVNNDNLNKLGVIDIKVKANTAGQDAFFFIHNEGATISSDTPFSVYATDNAGSTVSTEASNVNEFVLPAYLRKISVPNSGEYVTFSVTNKYTLKGLYTTSVDLLHTFNSSIVIDLTDLDYNDKLGALYCNEDTVGNVASLSSAPLNIVSIMGTYKHNVKGDFTPLITNNMKIILLKQEIALDFDQLNIGTSLESINIAYNEYVVGDVYDWAVRLWNNGSGKTSGRIAVFGNYSHATLGSYTWNPSGNIITFSAGGVSVS